MKKFVTALATASILVASMGSAQAGMSGLGAASAAPSSENLVQQIGISRRTGAAIVIGALIVGSAMSHASRKHERRCRRWFNRCEDGNERACWRYDTRC